MKNLSHLHCQQILQSIAPDAVKDDLTVVVNEEFTRLSFHVDRPFLVKLERFQEIYSHQLPYFDYRMVFGLALEICLKSDPTRGCSDLEKMWVSLLCSG